MNPLNITCIYIRILKHTLNCFVHIHMLGSTIVKSFNPIKQTPGQTRYDCIPGLNIYS